MAEAAAGPNGAMLFPALRLAQVTAFAFAGLDNGLVPSYSAASHMFCNGDVLAILWQYEGHLTTLGPC